VEVWLHEFLTSILDEGEWQNAGGWSRLYNEELHNLYVLPNFIRVIKSRRMRWEGHVAHMGEMRNAYKILIGKPEGRRPLRRIRL
jgi:hypothetical protein